MKHLTRPGLFSTLFALSVAIVAVLSAPSTSHAQQSCADITTECGSSPPNFTNCRVTQSTTFNPGLYQGLHVHICADNVTVDGNGATLRDGRILVSGRDNVRIERFNIERGGFPTNYAVQVQECYSGFVALDDISISGIDGTGGGVFVSNSSSVHITNSTIDLTNGSTFEPAIAVYGESSPISVNSCRITLSKFQLGILLAATAGSPFDPSVIGGNHITHSGTMYDTEGILVRNRWPTIVFGNVLDGHRYGIAVESDSNEIENNTILGPPANGTYPSRGGIRLGKNGNTVTGNSVSGYPSQGIELFDAFSQDNEITKNTIANCAVGLRDVTYESSNNRIYRNNFLDNTVQGIAQDPSRIWDAGPVCLGNHWSDFDTEAEGCTDSNTDGVCDNGRSQNGGAPIDRFPLVNPVTPGSFARQGVGGSNRSNLEPCPTVSVRLPMAGQLDGVRLDQNAPNPSRSRTAIRYRVPAISHVTLKVYDVRGQEVAKLLEGIQVAGEGVAEWNPVDRSGRPLPNGVYVYRLQVKAVEHPRRTFTSVRKFQVVR